VLPAECRLGHDEDEYFLKIVKFKTNFIVLQTDFIGLFVVRSKSKVK